MADDKPSYNFHQSGPDFRTAVKGKYAYVKAGENASEPDDDVFTRFRKIDRLFIAKYGCVRCPHKGTALCPYGVGIHRTVKRNHVLTPWETTVTDLPETNEKIIEVQEHRDGICAERTREIAFFTDKVTGMNGLLLERAENMRDMKDLKEKMQRIVTALESEPATFKTTDGDTKVKSVLAQYQDTLTKYNSFLDNAIGQQLKFEEIKSRDREGPRVIDVQAVESHIRKTLNAKPLVEIPKDILTSVESSGATRDSDNT